MGFKNDTDFNSDSYVRVNERLEEFRKDNPQGAITTYRSEAGDGGVVYKAVVCRNGQEVQLFGNTGMAPATGHAFLSKADRDGEKVEEFTETVAIGRALAVLGYQVEKAIASQEEMSKFKKSQSKFKVSEPTTEESAVVEEQEKSVSEPKLKSATNFKKSKFSRD